MLNRAVLWHLQLCLRLLDKLGYQMTAVNVAAAIDALTSEASTDDEISKLDLDRRDRSQLILEIYEKHGKPRESDSDSQGKGQFRDGDSEET